MHKSNKKFEIPKRLEHEIDYFPTVVRAEIDYRIELYLSGRSDWIPRMYLCNDGCFYFIDLHPRDIKIIKK